MGKTNSLADLLDIYLLVAKPELGGTSGGGSCHWSRLEAGVVDVKTQEVHCKQGPHQGFLPCCSLKAVTMDFTVLLTQCFF